MENENYSQLELFTGSAPVASPKNLHLSSRVLSFLGHYESVILVVIGLLITSIIAFSFGVERGKRCAVNLPQVSRPAPVVAAQIPARIVPKAITQTSRQPAVSPVAQAFTPLEKAQTARPVRKEFSNGVKERNSLTGFTVQIASYASRDYAQKEALSLNKKGISAAVIAKGKYFILCAGNFSNRQAAEMLLTKLKKQYRDCMVRKM